MYELESLVGIIIAIIIGSFAWSKTKNACIEKLRNAEATSPETAVKPEQAGITGWNRVTLESLPTFGIVGSTNDGRYYIVCKEERPS